MKLQQLRAELRKSKGSPHIVIDFGNGDMMQLVLQKTHLIEELGRSFDNDRTAETGIEFNADTGLLTATNLKAHASAPAAAVDFEEDDDDDLL